MARKQERVRNCWRIRASVGIDLKHLSDARGHVHYLSVSFQLKTACISERKRISVIYARCKALPALSIPYRLDSTTDQQVQRSHKRGRIPVLLTAVEDAVLPH